MNRLYTIVVLFTLALPLAVSAESFPSFPMQFWGAVTVNGNPAPTGTVVQGYYGSTLAGEVTVKESGVYGYESALQQKLLLQEGKGAVTFKIVMPSQNFGIATTGIPVIAYESFSTGATVKKDLAFMLPQSQKKLAELAPTVQQSGEKSAQVPFRLTGTTTDSGIITSVALPPEVTIMGPAGWDGTLEAPTATTTYIEPTAPSGYTKSVTRAVSIGVSKVKLTFNKGARLVFTGQKGSRVGWSDGSIFTEITASCSADTQAVGDALAAGADCKIDAGSDLVVWTKHFTTFVTYSVTAVTTSSGSSGGGGGGGGGGGAPIVPSVAGASTTTVPVTALIPTATTTSVAQVSSAQVTSGQLSYYVFVREMKNGSKGEDVTQLQKVLIAMKLLNVSAPTGTYGPATALAMKALQKSLKLTQTGATGPMTRAALNELAKTMLPPLSTVAIEAPKAVVASARFTTGLSRGMQHTQVLALQSILVRLGYLQATPNGYFGAATEAGVRRFQKAKGLEVTGSVGPKTRAALNAESQ